MKENLPAGPAAPNYLIDDQDLFDRAGLKFPMKKESDLDDFDKIYIAQRVARTDWFSLAGESLGVNYTYGGDARLGYYSKNKVKDKVAHFRRYEKVKAKNKRL